MIGTVQIERWTLLAQDIDGVPQTKDIGQLTERRTAYFAWRKEADAWLEDQQEEGFTRAAFGNAAMAYFGPTDSEGNCWLVSVDKVITKAEQLREKKLAAVKAMHDEVTPGGRMTMAHREDVATRIRQLLPLVRSAKWMQAVEDYAELVEDESNPLEWAYLQGSVWFAYAVM